MILDRTRKDGHQDNTVSIDRDDPGHRRIGVLVAHDEVLARRDPKTRSGVSQRSVGETVTVRPKEVDPEVPCHEIRIRTTHDTVTRALDSGPMAESTDRDVAAWGRGGPEERCRSEAYRALG